ncbi:hypothetical protein FOXYS1_6481, partial [Fusarium oxysporum]
MRLVNTQAIQVEFLADDNVPDYAILSHTWEQEEVLFHDMIAQSRERATLSSRAAVA